MPRRSLLAPFLAAFVPPRCGICAAACNASAPLCLRCRDELRRAPVFGSYRLAGLDGAWAAFEHAGVARRLVAAAKFRSRPRLAEVAAVEIVTRLPPGFLCGSSLVPVPADPWRSRRRGFDLAATLTRGLSQLTKTAISDGLERTRGGAHAGAPRAVRLTARPEVRAASGLPPAVVLVDDVATTGSTLGACADAARCAGAVRVSALTLTRSPGKQ